MPDRGDLLFKRDFYRALSDRPLDRGDPAYVPILEGRPNDPIAILGRKILWSEGESVQFVSGFRGTGKSTELRRLRDDLRAEGCVVSLIDIEDYINLSTPIDVSDFLIAVAGAFGEDLVAQGVLTGDPAKETYWERFRGFLTDTHVSFDELGFSGPLQGLGLEVKANLKSNPSFKKLLQQKMAGYLGALHRDVSAYMQGIVKAVKAARGQDTEVVLIVDSLEHLRGASTNAREVHESVETLFATHAEKLRFNWLHLVYTVPPYLKIRFSGLGGLYDPGGLYLIPSVHLRHADGNDDLAGYDLLEKIVRGRGDWRRLLGTRGRLDDVIAASGGHLRDLLRLLREILVRSDALPVPDALLEQAIDQIRTEYLPIADDDVRWLARIAAAREIGLTDQGALPDLTRFFDGHLILCYRNGHEWFDVHPLIRDYLTHRLQALARG